jgi:polar amino acid transport system substrate-binding protein
MTTRTPRLLVGVTILLALLAGCGDDGDDTTTTAAAGGGEASIELPDDVELVKAGQLTVCSDMPYEPFEFEEDGTTKGFDYEVVAAMSERLGLDVEFRTTPFDSIIAALAAGDCDMIASAMTITEAREEQVSFTEPYFDADQSLLILAENEGRFTSLQDLAGQDIGVQVETTGSAYAEENLPEGATIRSFQTGDEMFPALISGEIDAALQDFPVNAYRASQEPDRFVVTERFPTGEQYGFAVSQNATSLLEALDAALAEIREDGTYDQIFSTWFGDQD